MGLIQRLLGTEPPAITVVEESKAMVGSGAYALEYGGPGTAWWGSPGRWDSPKGMARAQALSHANPWIEKAERLVTGRVAALPWHLEDPDDETVDDTASESRQAILRLLEKPSPLTRPDWTWQRLIKITARHMGVVNVGAWYLDAMDPFGVPREILYLNPARLTPQFFANGQLRRWLLDAEDDTDDADPRRILELDEVRLFVLEPPDEGMFGTGLVEVADTKARLSAAADRFSTQTFQGGGRRGSFIAPTEGRMPEEVYEGLVKAMKNVRESPDSTKRDIVVKAPIDLTPQASTPQELQSTNLMEMTRNDILLIWGIDIQDAGIPGGGGLSSGQLREQARQSTFEGAVEPRVDVIKSGVQMLLDSWADATDGPLELIIEKPEFDDETPMFQRAQMARELPLRNRERRELVGLDPLGDPVLDNAVWLPVGLSEVFIAPDEKGNIPTAPEPEIEVTTPPVPLLGDGEEEPAKASPLGRTRASVERRVTPALLRDVAKVLRAQRDEVVRLVGEKASHLAKKPGDVRAFWNEDKWNAALARAIEPHLSGTAETVATETKRVLGHLNPSKAEPSFLEDVVRFVLSRGGERVVEMNRTARDAITAAIRDVVSQGAQEGLGPADIADRLTDRVGSLPVWDEARAETIARTETMFAYNDAALTSYREYGVERVEAIDGDEDEECASRNGQTYTLDESLAITDHPNGTLDWLPVL